MELFHEINKILASWDPIGVGRPISDNEYRGYVPKIYRSSKNAKKLKEALCDILDELGMSSIDDTASMNEMDEIVRRLMDLPWSRRIVKNTPQDGFYLGGTYQCGIPKPWTIQGTSVLENFPLK